MFEISMSYIKKKISLQLFSFLFFYKKIKEKLFKQLLLNISVGFLDGLGITMFLPLLQIVDNSKIENSSDLGNLQFLVDGMKKIGLEINLLNVLLILCLFFLLKGGAIFLNGAYSTTVKQSFSKKIKTNLYESLSRVSFKSFVKSDVGRIQNSMTSEVYKVVQAYETYFYAFQQLIFVFVYMIFAFFVDPIFASLILVGGTLTSLLFNRVFKITKNKSSQLSRDNHKFQGLVLQFVGQYKYLKVSGLLKRYTDKLDKSIDEINENQLKIGLLGSFVSAIREPILIVIVSLVIFVQVSFFGGSLSVILVSLLFFYRALSCLMMMQNSYNNFLSVSGALNNMIDFEYDLENSKENKGVRTFKKLHECLELKSVTFSYEDALIIDNIDLKIPKNKTIAFVGESGSGKTTIVNILTGLLTVESGLYLIDGVDKNEIDITTFQKRVGYITQDAVIFNDTIFNNVTFWDQATDENIKKFNKVLKLSASSDFVDLLPDREKTMLGNNGINLSGGQKQRISIARELYKDIDLLVLDEATSALDSETEETIKNSIDQLQGKITMLIVAHRLSTIKKADNIVIMDKGKIENSGVFSELKLKSTKFKRMVELQDV